MLRPSEKTIIALEIVRGATDAKLAEGYRSRHGMTDDVTHAELEAMGALLRRQVEAQAQEKEAGK